MTYPQVIGEFATLDAILAGKSIARYGDGELKLMHGAGYSRQPATEEITAELVQILQNPHKNCLAGVPTMDPQGPKYDNWMRHAERFAKLLRPDKVQYYSAFISRPDSAPWINTVEFAEKVDRLWRGKDAVIVSEVKNSIIEAVKRTAASTCHVQCPSHNAYDEISRLEFEIGFPKPEIVILSCGPTATCLANRLASRGIHAVDIGSAGGFLYKLLEKKPIVKLAAPQQCQFCRYWSTLENRNEASDSIAECRRHGPIANSVQKWPITYSSEWCGEFKAVKL